MNNKQMKELINDGFGRLYPLSQVDWRDHRQMMLDDELRSEKQHRASAPFNLRPKFSMNIVAKYFVIKAIRNAMRNDHFRPRDILHCKQSSLLAHAIKDDDRFDLLAMMDGFDWFEFESIDYVAADLVCILETA
tara:strand:- start:98 stop:499 length:402 start_codon:yes stop_codon:yes gene_type:complete